MTKTLRKTFSSNDVLFEGSHHRAIAICKQFYKILKLSRRGKNPSNFHQHASQISQELQEDDLGVQSSKRPGWIMNKNDQLLTLVPVDIKGSPWLRNIYILNQHSLNSFIIDETFFLLSTFTLISAFKKQNSGLLFLSRCIQRTA